MKVCLINPPHPYLKQPTAQAPLGLLYVAAMLKKTNIDVEVLDLSSKHFQDPYSLPSADIYGITGTVLDRTPCTEVAKRIKHTNPTSKVVVGGPISLSYKNLNYEVIDAVVRGEGEYEILKIIDDFPNIHQLYLAERITDLDLLPFPYRDGLTSQGGNVFAYNKQYKGTESAVIITSRGCPYGCAFCASPGIWGRKVVFRSVDNVLSEVEEIVKKYKIYQLRFSDDTLTLHRDHLYKLCDGLKLLEVVWRASIRVVPNDLDLFKKMYDCGCREVSFGIESGDQDVLDALNKGTTVHDNYLAIVNAKKAGLVVRLLFMCGTPGETKHTAEKNISFLESVNNSYDTIALTNFIPIPGSAIANNPDKFECIVVDEDIDHYNFYMWGPSGLNKWDAFINPTNLDLATFIANKDRLRVYVENSGKSNRG